jgi:tetratricopeptide (TPR) repeat protein
VRPRHTPVGVYTLGASTLTLFLLLFGAVSPLSAQDGSARQKVLDALVAGDYLQAAELSAAWIEAEPTIALPRIYAGRAALGDGDPREAQDHLRRAVALDPEDGEAWWWLGQALRAEGDEDAALAAYWRSARLDTSGPAETELATYNPDWLAYNAAYTEYARGEYARCLYAARTLSARTDLDSGLIRSVQLMESECLLRLGRVAEGLDVACRLIEGQPDLRPMGVNLASIALESGLFALAERLLAVSPEANGPDNALIRAWAGAANGAVEAPLQALAEAISEPNLPVSVSECVRRQSLFDGALHALAASAEADDASAQAPGSPEAQTIAGALTLLREDTEAGIGLLTRGATLGTGNPWLAERLAWGLRLVGSHNEALAALEASADPDTPLIRGERLDILLFLGRLEAADELLTAWRADSPEDGTLVYRHAALLAEMGRYEEAQALLRAEGGPETALGADLNAWADYLEALATPPTDWPESPRWEGEARRLRVRIAADEEFRRDPDWRGEIARIMEGIAPPFRDAGIELEVSREVEWDSRDRAWTLNELHAELRREVRRDRDDLVLGFTAQSYGGGEVTGGDVAMGEAALLQDYAIIRFDRLGDITPQMRLLQVAHELAHIFGAHHVESDRTIMRSRMSGRPVLDLDPFNRRILYLTRGCDFDAGAASLSEEGRAALMEHRVERAAEAPDDPTHYVDLAQMAVDLGDEAALDWARRAVVITPEELAWRILYADLLAWDRQIDRAREELTRLVPIALESADIAQVRSMGRSLAMLGEHEAAASLLRRTVDLTQRDGWLLAEYAVMLYAGGEHDLARELLRTALRVEPDDPFLRGEIAGALIELEQPDEALAEAQIAVEMDPRNPVHWERLGHVRVERKEREEALVAFQSAIDADAEYAYAHNALAWTLVELGRFEEAEAPVRECLRLEPSYAPAIDTLGHVLNGLGRPQEGLGAFDEALRLMPREPASWYGRGASLEALGRIDEAIDAYQRALAEDLPGGEWIEKAGERLKALGVESPSLDAGSGDA